MATLSQIAAEARRIPIPEPPPAQPKLAPSDTVRREIDRIARQLDGLTNRLKRVKDSL
jgi:hypothetical protein